MTTLEALAPLVLRRSSGELRLGLGEIFVLPDEEAARLLKKAPGKVRLVPDQTMLAPVYWERGDGSISGPATVELFYRLGSSDGLIVRYGDEMLWVNTCMLRSKRQWLEQRPVIEIDPSLLKA